MKSKEIFAIALLAIMVASLFAFAPAPVVAAADNSLFKITIVAPGGANLLRRQWGLIIANSYQSVGIDAKVVFLGWGSVYDRILTPTDMSVIGKTWDQGGYDALLIGWTPGSPSTPFLGTMQIYYSANTPPNSNYYLWNNSESDNYIMTMLTSGYNTEGITAFKNWQYVQFMDLPASQIAFQQAILTADSDVNFNGYEWIFDNIGPVPQFLTGMDEIVLASTGELLGLNPPLSNSWYDTICFNPIFDSMFWLDANFTYQYGLCTDLVISPDKSTYTYTLRENVLFHDGVEMTANDVLFSFLAYLNPATGSQQSGIEVGYMGNDITFTWENGTSTRLVVDLGTSTGIYPATNETGTRQATITALDQYTVEITIADFEGMTQPVATFHPEADGVAILPMHVLESVPFSEWSTHPFNTGTGTYTSNSQTFSGPIGTSAYVFKSYDATTATVSLEKFNNFWDKTNLESQGQFVVEKYYVRYIEGKDAAVAALKNNEVQILDQNYQQAADYQAGNLNFADNYVLKGSGLQQMGYNMQHPVFGTGTATPLGISNPARAAEAARYVRQAMDYLIPRTLIINNLLGGLSDAGAVHVNPLSPYYNASIVPREYNPTAAKELLAMAGYNVGVTPGGPTVLGNTILLGEAVTLTGVFTIDPVAAFAQGGIVVLLQQSTDNSTWTPVAQGVTTTGGYYSLSYQPATTGNFLYRAYLTGVGAQTAAATMATGPTFPYDGITLSVDPQTTSAVNMTVVSVDTAIASYRNQVTALNTQVTALSAQAANATNLAYAGIVLAIIALAVAAVFGMRKK